ncbi:MAG: GNAT family N-acetyltransferase [Ruminococcaceae bacterium]|nr:GNAT family N-acetyltransferase [Oscillospiraceae bacterium]
MELLTDDLILRTVTRADIDEIARMWNFFQGGVSVEEAHGALEYMNSNHARNRSGILHHLCLAVCRKNDPARIWGWCGLDGTVRPERPEVFVLLHESVRGMGFGTQCVKALLSYAFDTVGLHSVHGGCDKDNIASARMMENAGMRRYGSMESGDPLFIAGKSPCDI